MALIDTTHLTDQAKAKTPGWAALMAHLDIAHTQPLRQRPIEAELSARLRTIQQMLLAGALAAGMILAVAGVMMIKFL
jgi:hypothetical protein